MRRRGRPPGPSRHDSLQKEMVAAALAARPGLALQASNMGVHLAGGARAGKNLKELGGFPGEPDISVREQGRRGEPGLFAEVKTPGTFLEPHQARRIEELEARGFVCIVVRSTAELLEALDVYLPEEWAPPRALPAHPRRHEPRIVRGSSTLRVEWERHSIIVRAPARDTGGGAGAAARTAGLLEASSSSSSDDDGVEDEEAEEVEQVEQVERAGEAARGGASSAPIVLSDDEEGSNEAGSGGVAACRWSCDEPATPATAARTHVGWGPSGHGWATSWASVIAEGGSGSGAEGEQHEEEHPPSPVYSDVEEDTTYYGTGHDLHSMSALYEYLNPQSEVPPRQRRRFVG